MKRRRIMIKEYVSHPFLFCLVITLGFFLNPNFNQSTDNQFTGKTFFLLTPAQAQQCRESVNGMKKFCSENPQLVTVQNGTRVVETFLNDNSGGTAAQALQMDREGQLTRETLLAMKEACGNANKKCQETCTAEEQRDLGECMENTCVSVTQNTYTELRSQCEQEFEAGTSAFNISLGEVAQLLMAVGGLLQAFGVGKKDPPSLASLTDKDDDKDCDGPYAHTLIKCTGRSDPLGGRAGASGIGGGPGGIAQGNSPFNLASSKENLGKSGNDGDNQGTHGAGPGGSSGFGSFGSLGQSGQERGVASMNQEEDGSDGGSYGNKYMGVGSSGDGGGGSFGLGRGIASYGGFKSKKAKGLGKDIKNKIKRQNAKLMQNAREPASVKGLNGPFQDNWEVIRKAYKKNANTLIK